MAADCSHFLGRQLYSLPNTLEDVAEEVRMRSLANALAPEQPPQHRSLIDPGSCLPVLQMVDSLARQVNFQDSHFTGLQTTHGFSQAHSRLIDSNNPVSTPKILSQTQGFIKWALGTERAPLAVWNGGTTPASMS